MTELAKAEQSLARSKIPKIPFYESEYSFRNLNTPFFHNSNGQQKQYTFSKLNSNHRKDVMCEIYLFTNIMKSLLKSK
jgi:hypothetical protein